MWRLGYLLMFMFSPILLFAAFAKDMWDEGYAVHLFVGVLVFLAIYSAIKPPYY